LLLKLEFLRYVHGLSDRQVIDRGQTDLSFRYLLQVDVYEVLPDPSSLCLFRGRLGRDGFRKVFDQVVSIAREHGFVRDRLRIKDASHVIADIAVPTTLGLVAQARDKLLAAAEAFDPLRVEGERVNIELLRQADGSRSAEARLVARVTHLREILLWVDELTPPEEASTDRRWETLLQYRRLAHKILADQDHPRKGDRTRSTTDPDARRAKHGEWYDGFLLDVMIDSDSEIITEVNVLPANGDEAHDALELIQQEEATHGNEIEALSIDGIGFNGPLLRELEDPEGLHVNTFVPPPKESKTAHYTPEDFVEDPAREAVTCPAGQLSRYRERDQRDHGWIYRYRKATCVHCPQVAQCMAHPPQGTFGKTVRKNDYQIEYRQARQKATTAEYAQVRSEHPKVERKLSEVMNRYGGRRARYRGRPKVLIQELMACTAANVSRLVRLLRAPTAKMACQS
jgi:IS5 family transposase